MKSYQIRSTFDRDYDYNLPTYARSVRHPKGFVCGNLPAGINLPMAARDTLLAQNLRTGRGLAFNTTCGAGVTPTKRRFVKPSTDCTPIGFDAFAVARKSEALRGKLIGVEIEYFPTRGIDAPNAGLSQSAYDGSLGNSGKEIRRLTWADANGRLQGVIKLALNGTIDTRCGLHVHIDVRHLDETARLAAYERLTGFYPFLKKLVPKSRLRNKYCKWVSNSHSRNACRYAAINFQSSFTHGTIEFRCQGGSLNPVKIETWALLCRFLVTHCSDPLTSTPRTWAAFIAILPEPLRSWCILRKEKISGTAPLITARTLSAIDMIYNATSASQA